MLPQRAGRRVSPMHGTRSHHLESCRPGQDQANRYVPVRTGTYQYKAVQASRGFSRLVQAGTRKYRISPVWYYKSVQDGTTALSLSTRILRIGGGRYKSVQDFPDLYKTVQDGTSQYMIFPVSVQDGNSQYRIFLIGTRRYKTVQVST